MKLIYKYPLELGLNELEIPYVKIISVINRGSHLSLYVVVDVTIPDKKLQVAVCNTGQELEDSILHGQFLGTVTDGMFVRHVFYK